jgi:poly(3-hydroxyalkanoate) depolymerase
MLSSQKKAARTVPPKRPASPERPERASARSPEATTTRFVEVDGVRLRTRVRGSGPPLLFLTGLGASLDFGAPFERELVARGRQVISFDAPGVGQSTPYTRPRRMRGVAGTVQRMLNTLGYDRVDVVGVSLGGVVAQQLSFQAPNLVDRLVLAATGPGLGGVPGSPRVLLSMATPRRYYQPDYYRRIAGRVYGGAARKDPDALLHGSVARFIERPSVRGYLGQLYAISGWTSMPWLHRLRQPTLVLAGDDDPIVPLVNGRLLTWRIPQSRMHVIRGGGHLFLLERPADVAALIADFLDADAPGGANPPGEPGSDR